MSLVNELQDLAETADILTVLRKAKRVSGKLHRNDILEWIKNELNGYTGEVPNYRIAKSDLYYNTNGCVPAGWGYVRCGSGPLPHFGLNGMPMPINDSVVNLQTALDEQSGNGLAYDLPLELENTIRSHLSVNYHHILLFMLVSNLEIQRIVHSVRDVVLDWAIKLEQEGVVGEGHSFTAEEKRKAANIKFNIFYVGDNAVVGAIGQGAAGNITT